MNMKHESRTQNASRNIKFGIIQKMVAIGCPFAIRTLLLYVLGAEYIGLNSLFSSILQVLSLTELGFGSAMIYALYKPMAEDDKDIICALLSFYRKIYLIIGIIMLIVGISLLPFLHLLIKNGLPTDVNLYVLYFVYLSNSIISYFLYAYKQCLLTAAQRSDIISKRSTIIQVVCFILQATLVIFTRNYYFYIIIIPLSTILTNVANSIITDKLYPQYKCFGNIDKNIKIEITKKTIALFGTKLNSIVLHTSDSIILSAFIGLNAVAIYGNYYYIMDAVGGFILIIYSSLTASIGNSIVRESKDKNYNDFKTFTFIHYWLIGFCTICLLCLYEPFMKIWVSKDNLLYPFGMVVCFSIYFYVFQIRKVIITYKDAAGLWWEEKLRPYIVMVVNLSLNLILINYIGYYGIVLSTIVSLIISFPWETRTVFRYLFKKSQSKYYQSISYYFIITIITAVCSYSLCNIIPISGWLACIVRGLICVVVVNLMFVLAYFKRKEFKQAILLIKRIISKQ